MPINKNALLRYQILDRCFSNRHHKYEIEELVDKVNEAFLDIYGTTVSLRQIRADINHMRDRLVYDAPIEAIPIEGRKCYYRYSDPNFSIFNHELSVDEIKKLRSTIDMLGRYRGGDNGWLEEVISNLELRFGIKANRERLVSFEQNSQLKGLNFLSELIDATINHQPLKMVYQPYKGEEQTTIIHPHYIKQYNTRWFLFGVEDHGDYGMTMVNKALDRIVRFSISDVPFVENTTVDYESYFNDIVGVTHDSNHTEVELVRLKFDPARFPYVVSKPIHSSQEVVDNEQCILEIKIRVNRELEQSIFAFGSHVEVLSPDWFRAEIKEKVDKLSKIYSTV